MAVIEKSDKTDQSLIPVEAIATAILVLRGQRVILDADLARLYGVTTKRLNQQVRRNSGRFPDDFVFQLSDDEAENLRLHFAASSLSMEDAGTGRSPSLSTVRSWLRAFLTLLVP